MDSWISGARVPDQASLLMNRSDNEHTTSPQPHAGIQGEGAGVGAFLHFNPGGLGGIQHAVDPRRGDGSAEDPSGATASFRAPRWRMVIGTRTVMLVAALMPPASPRSHRGSNRA